MRLEGVEQGNEMSEMKEQSGKVTGASGGTWEWNSGIEIDRGGRVEGEQVASTGLEGSMVLIGFAGRLVGRRADKGNGADVL